MNDLLELAIEAHGGMARWNEAKNIDFKLSLSGGLWKIKGFPAGLPNVSMHIDTRRPALSIAPYAGNRQSAHFVPDRVWIEDSDGSIVDQRQTPRSSFAGHVLQTKWDQMQEIYFASYALWNYMTTPFLLAGPGFEVREIEPHQENGETWRRLYVKFPQDVPTHCEEQTFFFNEKGLLQRLDYVTDVAGGVASHYCFDHASFGGLIFPTLRRVVRRTPDGPMLSSPTAVLLQISDVLVT